MDRITKSFVESFAKDNDIDDDITVQFEHFTNYAIVDPAIEDHYEVRDLNIGVNGTIGIDGFALVLNGYLINEVDELVDFLVEHKKAKADIYFIQAKTSASFDAKDIGSFAYSVADFVSENPKQSWTAVATAEMELFNELIQRVNELKENPECHLYYVSLGKLSDDANLEARRTSGIQDLESENLFSKVSFNLLGAKEIQAKFKAIDQAIVRSFEYEQNITLPVIEGVDEAYLGIIKCSEIVRLMKSDSGHALPNIFYDNVRDYQGGNSVNLEITKSLAPDTSQAFVVLNNGITIVSDTLGHVRNQFTISNYQIINGCQTSHVLFENQDKLSDNVYVTLKLIVTKDKNLTSRVIRSTNRQTEVKEQDLIAFTDFQKRLEDFYSTFTGPWRLYYERRSKQYARQSIEKKKIVDKAQQIKACASMYFDKPDMATRFFGALFREFKDRLFSEDHFMEPYYAASFCLYRIEQLFAKKEIDRKYYKIKYHLVMLVRREIKNEQCPQFNSKKGKAYAEEIIAKLSNDDVFRQCVKLATIKIDSISPDISGNEISKSKKFVADCVAKYS